MKRPSNSVHRTLALVALFLTVAIHIRAQERPPLCDTDTLIISTGWDRLKDTLEIFAKADPYWRMGWDDPTEPLPVQTLSGSAQIGLPAPISSGECRWVGTYNGPRETSNQTGDVYIFETEFCVTEIVNQAWLECDFLAITLTRIYLNGQLIGETTQNGVTVYDPFHIEMDVTPYLRVGRNIIHVEQTLYYEGQRGLALTGYISAESEATATPFNCDACGHLTPMERMGE